MRGEKRYDTDTASKIGGSPPRARGKGDSIKAWGGDTGITPACAGKSVIRRIVITSVQDHPRVRGEKCPSFVCDQTSRGSPPRARGKASQAAARSSQSRITPACAGKSWDKKCEMCGKEDHPRVCGEKLTCETRRLRHIGSPPRVRGKAVLPLAAYAEQRITPACAGKSGQTPTLHRF